MNLAQDLKDLMKSSAQFMSDYDQRSALGIADSWARGSQVETPLARYDDDGPVNRDGLAATLIEKISDADKDDARKALHEARMFVNEPYANDPKILAWRKQRHEKFPEGIGVSSK